jgi:hypothetical protein
VKYTNEPEPWINSWGVVFIVLVLVGIGWLVFHNG